MRKKTFGLLMSGGLVTVAGAMAGIYHLSARQAKSDQACALVADLSDYFHENHRLPDQWSEFVGWYDQNHEKPRWVEGELSRQFGLQTGVTRENYAGYATVLRVNCTALKGREGTINQALKDHLMVDALLAPNGPAPSPAATNGKKKGHDSKDEADDDDHHKAGAKAAGLGGGARPDSR